MVSKLEFLCLILCVQRDLAGCAQQFPRLALYNFLFANYSSHLHPECEDGTPVGLQIDITLRQILGVNEPEQVLMASIWIRSSWQDSRLVWDPADHDNISSFNVLYGDVWQPDLTLYESVSTSENMLPGREKYHARIIHNGKVIYNFPTVVKTRCGMNVKQFPFDTQVCELKFGTWSYHGLEIDISYANDGGNLDRYIENSEWILKEFRVRKKVNRYLCCVEPYPLVIYFLHIQRRPTFYLITMLFPCVLAVFVAGFAFILPTESGEKVSLEITILLSLSVFLLLVSESLPPSSENFPDIGLYFAVSMVLVNMALLQTVFVVNLYYRGNDGRRAPRWVRRLFFDYLSKIICLKSQCRRGMDPGKMIASVNIDDFKATVTDEVDVKENNIVSTTLNNNASEYGSGIIEDNIGSTIPSNKSSGMQEQRSMLKWYETIKQDTTAADEWKAISNILDRLFLIMYSLVAVVVTVLFLMEMLAQI